MKRTLSLLFILYIIHIAYSQKVVSHGEIYKSHQGAVVGIDLGKFFSGNGFIVSADGIIFTANHVVATKESKFREYAADIVVVIGDKPCPATPLVPVISDDQVNYDYALFKIAAPNLPYVSFGEWDKTDVGDSVTLI